MDEMTALLLRGGLTPRDVTLREVVALWERREHLFGVGL